MLLMKFNILLIYSVTVLATRFVWYLYVGKVLIKSEVNKGLHHYLEANPG